MYSCITNNNLPLLLMDNVFFFATLQVSAFGALRVVFVLDLFKDRRDVLH